MIWLWGCSTAVVAPPPQVFDEQATEASIDALCKLFEGADMECRRGTGGVMVEGRTFGVRAEISTQEATAMVSLRGVVKLESAKTTYTTRLRGFGGTKKEALKRSTHEWALVSGTAAVDSWVNPEKRHILKAVEPTQPQPLGYGEGRVLRGWTMFQPRGVLEHAELLSAVAPALGPDAKGVLTFEATRQSGETQVECFFEGVPHDAVCKRARAWSWPGGSYELRTAYVFMGPR